MCGVGCRPPPGVLARSGALPFVQHRYAWRNYAPEGGCGGLRYAQTTASTLLRFASAILRSASLSPCTLLRSVKKRCPALLRRAGRYLCGVGYRPPPSALLPSALIKVSVAATPLPRGCRHTALGRVARLRIPPLPHPNMGAVGSTPLTFLIRGGVLPPAPISRAPSPQGERLPIA